MAATIVLLLLACGANAQVASYLVSQRGAKCLTAHGSVVVASACAASAEQRVQPNFSVGGLKLGTQCLRRTSSTALGLAACREGDSAEVFEINDTMREVLSSDGTPACVTLAGNDWRNRQTITLTPCGDLAGQKWLLATEQTVAPQGRKRSTDSLGEIRAGDAIVVGSLYLVVK